MSKPLKKTMTREYQSLFEDVAGACVVDLTGMDAEAVHELRGQLRQHGMSLRVVKNRIFRQSFREGPLAPLAAHLDGPCAVVTGESFAPGEWTPEELAAAAALTPKYAGPDHNRRM